jgi:hypothetical protein
VLRALNDILAPARRHHMVGSCRLAGSLRRRPRALQRLSNTRAGASGLLHAYASLMKVERRHNTSLCREAFQTGLDTAGAVDACGSLPQALLLISVIPEVQHWPSCYDLGFRTAWMLLPPSRPHSLQHSIQYNILDEAQERRLAPPSQHVVDSCALSLPSLARSLERHLSCHQHTHDRNQTIS